MKPLMIAVAVAAMASATIAEAATFVGSWQVAAGPNWTTVPAAYTGQEAAALLFGGNASDYEISTIDSNPLNIDFQSWVSVWGVGGGTKVSQNFKVSTSGLYQTEGDTSAYVDDNATGPQFTNYAFLVDAVPEPASWAMMIAGFGLVGAAARRRRAVAA